MGSDLLHGGDYHADRVLERSCATKGLVKASAGRILGLCA